MTGMIVTLIIIVVICGCLSTEVYGNWCTGTRYNDLPYCEKQRNFMNGFRCVDGNCRKTFTSCKTESTCLTSIDVCKLTCGQTSIWPLPTGDMSLSKVLLPVRSKNKHIKFDYDLLDGDKENGSIRFTLLIRGLENKLLNHLSKKVSASSKSVDYTELSVKFVVKESATSFTEETDESYLLNVTTRRNFKTEANIIGNTYFGVRHGLETLLQLIVYDEKSKLYIMPIRFSIRDQPVFKYRGLMLDTARRYYPIESIKKTLDAMALNKMNTFHWHMIDTQSFPYVSKKYPQMAAIGAYSKKQVYTRNDIKEIVEYARRCGIRVLPEFDAPANVGEGWQNFTDPKTGDSYLNCFNAQPWSSYCIEPPCGQLNPTVKSVYEVLGNLYKEYTEMFDSDLFHMGGNEISLNCWKTPQIMEWMERSPIFKESQKDLHVLWYYFQKNALRKLEAVNGGRQKIVLRTSSLTKHDNVDQYFPPNKYIMQIWESRKKSEHIPYLLKRNYKLIFSMHDELYLNGVSFGVDDGHNWRSLYKECQKLYMSNPFDVVKQLNMNINEEIKEQILGSEAAMWSEQADSSSADSRIWPRVAALAERLWSNPATGWKKAKSRISYHRERIVSLGVQADVLEPAWCLYNDGEC